MFGGDHTPGRSYQRRRRRRPQLQETLSIPGGNGESIQGYFRRIFHEKPKLLKERSNDELLARWLADHPSETEVPKRVKSGLANLSEA